MRLNENQRVDEIQDFSYTHEGIVKRDRKYVSMIMNHYYIQILIQINVLYFLFRVGLIIGILLNGYEKHLPIFWIVMISMLSMLHGEVLRNCL